jgi:hypothetical protein
MRALRVTRLSALRSYDQRFEANPTAFRQHHSHPMSLRSTPSRSGAAIPRRERVPASCLPDGNCAASIAGRAAKMADIGSVMPE